MRERYLLPSPLLLRNLEPHGNRGSTINEVCCCAHYICPECLWQPCMDPHILCPLIQGPVHPFSNAILLSTVISKLTTTVFTTVVKLQTFDLQSSFILNSNFPLSKGWRLDYYLVSESLAEQFDFHFSPLTDHSSGKCNSRYGLAGLQEFNRVLSHGIMSRNFYLWSFLDAGNCFLYLA
ncbi:hypothetical protein AKJ16_DCAP22834 [Drosera capensis]